MKCTFLLKTQVKKKNKENKSKIIKQAQVSQIDNLIASLSNDTVNKLIKMLQRDIRHSIRQLELLTRQNISFGSKRWSAERVCSAKLSDIRMQEDLWAVYVRGFTEGYKSAEVRLNFNSQHTKQQLEVKSNPTLATNFSSLKCCQSPGCSTVLNQEDQPDASAILPVPSIEKHEVPITCNEVAINPCFSPLVLLEPQEYMVLEPDMQAYFDSQRINNSSSQLYENAANEVLSENGVYATFGTHMLCGMTTDFACEVSSFVCKKKQPLTRRTHSNDWPYACDYCGLAFKKRYSLVQHYRSHTGEKLYVCDDCDKSYAHHRSLRAHHKKHHHCPDKTSYMCDTCGKRFRLRSSLTKHYRSYRLHGDQIKYGRNACRK